jgi:hypothetical protein
MNEHFEKKADSVYSKRLKAGKRRTYFFDVRATRGNDYFLTITESRKRPTDDGYDRHKIFLYKEDFNKFIRGLNDAIDFVKTELMPDFDFDSFNHDQSDMEGVPPTGKTEIAGELLEPNFGPEAKGAAPVEDDTVAKKDIIDGTDRAGFDGHSAIVPESHIDTVTVAKADDHDGHEKQAAEEKFVSKPIITEEVDRW